MATISKQKVNGVSYDLMDKSARENTNYNYGTGGYTLDSPGDANDLVINGIWFVGYSISGSTRTYSLANVPDLGSSGWLRVTRAFATSNIILQEFVSATKGISYYRRRDSSNVWSDWGAGASQNFGTGGYTTSNQGDADTLLEDGTWFVSTNGTDLSLTHLPDIGEAAWLRVTRLSGYNMAIQELLTQTTGRSFTRSRNASGTWSAWSETGEYAASSADWVSYYDNSGREHNNATFTWSDDKNYITVVTDGAVSPTPALLRMWYRTAQLPNGWVPGQSVYCIVGQLTDGMRIGVTFYKNSEQIEQPAGGAIRILGNSVTEIHIPSDAEGLLVTVGLVAGTDIPTAVTVHKPIFVAGIPAQFAAPKKELSVLCFGSSFSYSDFGCLGALMNEICPDLDFTFGICYKSGGTIEDHISYLTNNTAFAEYSEWSTAQGKWLNTASVTGKDALRKRKWDFVMIQPSSRQGPLDYPLIETLANLILQQIDYPMSFLLNFAHVKAPSGNFSDALPVSEYSSLTTGQEKSDHMYELNAALAQAEAGKFIVSAVIPCATAIKNAWGTTLKTLGEEDWMCYDTTSHLQNGIGPLVTAYTAAYKLCELIGVPVKMYNSQINPTAAWLTRINLYTYVSVSHGSPVGVSNTNKLIAQKCAMAAIKNPYETTEI